MCERLDHDSINLANLHGAEVLIELMIRISVCPTVCCESFLIALVILVSSEDLSWLPLMVMGEKVEIKRERTVK